MKKRRFLLWFTSDIVNIIDSFCIATGIVSRNKFFRELVDKRLTSNKSDIKKASETIREIVDEKTN